MKNLKELLNPIFKITENTEITTTLENQDLAIKELQRLYSCELEEKIASLEQQIIVLKKHICTLSLSILITLLLIFLVWLFVYKWSYISKKCLYFLEIYKQSFNKFVFKIKAAIESNKSVKPKKHSLQHAFNYKYNQNLNESSMDWESINLELLQNNDDNVLKPFSKDID